MSCFCFLKFAVDFLDGKETAYKRRFGHNFSGPLIPFGAEINYKPITPRDEARLQQFGTKALPGVFVGYEQQAGGGWTGNLNIINWEQMENAEIFSDVYVKRFLSLRN